MKTLKVLSIIGIILIFLWLIIFIRAVTNIYYDRALVLVMIISTSLILAYSLSLSIVVLVKSTKKPRSLNTALISEELSRLAELKDKGYLTEEEFDTKKGQLLKLLKQ